MRNDHIATKNLISRRYKTVYLILGISLSMAVIVCLYLLNRSMEETIANSFDEIGSNIVVTFKENLIGKKSLTVNDIIKINSIKNRKNIAVIAPKLIDKLKVKNIDLIAVGVDFPAEINLKKKWWILKGDKPYRSNDLLLGSYAAKKLSLNVGDKLDIYGKEFIVRAILNKTGTDDDNTIFVNLLTLQELLNKEGELSLIEVAAFCYTCPIESISSQISKKLPYADVKIISSILEQRKQTVEKFEVFSRVITTFTFITMIIFVSVVVFSNIMERLKEIGIFRTIGFRKSDIVEIFFTEAIIVGFIGGAIGYLIGFLLAKIADLKLFTEFNLNINFSFILFGIVIIVSVFIVIISTLIPAIKAANTDPIKTLNFT
ncbi:ABC transporter permease [Deferribacter autotrophicus]|uniref:ABC transporter permease n=1 Tax=Deferribacter autotrophicus TaxID=500465 RepID=A0A5A8F5N0_9BACT|nr:FtsX-like permease family protein [Deferribacter autotrophicus]KAA0257157.1 ABC transporter permease [Deferribacter autotrophicus]